MEPKKRPISKHGKQKWEVDFGYDEYGNRPRPVFKTEQEADDAIDAYHKDVKKAGDFWTRLTPSERKETAGVLEEIKAAGRTVRGVWEDWKRWRKDNQQTVVEPMAYSKVVEEWARRKLAAGKTQQYVHDACGTVLNKFGLGRKLQSIHEISAAELEKWINARCILQPGETEPELKSKPGEEKPKRTWSLSSKRTNMSLFSGLWEVAVAKGWASFNIVKKLEPVGKIGREVRIFPNETVINLFAAALENEVTQKALAELALGFFGCMRPEEVTSEKALAKGKPPFDWSCIDLKHGVSTVSRDVAKTGDQRNPRLQPTAVAWLKLAKDLGNELPPKNETKIIDQLCEMIGLTDWIRDGMRKNCATHLRTIYRNDYDVVKDMGNSVRILLKHYAELNTPEPVSLDHWQITPERVREYRKTEAWRNVLVEASKIKEERIKKEIEEREREAEQEKLKKAADAKEVKGPATKPGPSASETEKSARST